MFGNAQFGDEDGDGLSCLSSVASNSNVVPLQIALPDVVAAQSDFKWEQQKTKTAIDQLSLIRNSDESKEDRPPIIGYIKYYTRRKKVDKAHPNPIQWHKA
ncbi:hypothetical protein GIB67_036728 [Kingdonia uniflora]|uniref:Uncharacterized protein n=1 Tax=Kingdonia uniflora TaxID=39325 RepID=A0A7J7LWP4_9MAGN|nr:hypothetical protein GIB67_036728 [Kingdonia uniflora]